MRSAMKLRMFAAMTAALALGGGALGLAPAALAATGQAAAAEKHCVIVLAPLEEGETVSEVLKESCAPTKAQAMRQADVAPAAWYELFMMAEHANWGGAYTWIGGSAKCDADGYGITPTSWWRNNVSSTSHSRYEDTYCDRMNIRNDNHGWRLGLNAHSSGLPSGFNDDVDYIQFYNG